MFTRSLLRLRNSGATAADFFDDVGDSYGIDDNGPVPLEENEGVVVPECRFLVSSAQQQELAQYDPQGNSDEFGTDIYFAVRRCLL